MAKLFGFSNKGKLIGTIDNVTSWKVESDDGQFILNHNSSIDPTERKLIDDVARLQTSVAELYARLAKSDMNKPVANRCTFNATDLNGFPFVFEADIAVTNYQYIAHS